MTNDPLDLPALRAVIAGVRENLNRWSEAVMVGCRRDSLTTLADACERLAEENERMREQLTAAEAAREEDFASFVASELFAQEVRQNAMEYAAKCCEGRAMGNKNTTARHEAEKCAMAIRYHARNAHLVRALDLPTPSAALQRVREQEAERALRWAADNPPGSGGARDLPEARADDPVDQWQGYIERGLAALLPTPDAEGK